jgi:hypothetical protein
MAITIHSVFDSKGRRITEYNAGTGALIREYVWMGCLPSARKRARAFVGKTVHRSVF